MAWSTRDIPDQSGRLAIVTGANTGLGFETADALVAAGATVVLACRAQSKADAAADDIRRRHPGAAVETLRLELGDLSQIETAAKEALDRFDRIDLLINNAGVMMPPYSKTVDGFELQMGTNHFGHFALTGRLLPRILDTAGSRIVTVSSLAHTGGKMRWDDLDWNDGYKRSASYGQSKLANLLFTFELDRRLREGGHDTEALAAHPGISSTELARHLPLMNVGIVQRLVAPVMNRFVSQSAADGALPTLRAATDPEAAGGQYYGPDGKGETRGAPALAAVATQATQQDDWARLWDLSIERTGVTPPV